MRLFNTYVRMRIQDPSGLTVALLHALDTRPQLIHRKQSGGEPPHRTNHPHVVAPVKESMYAFQASTLPAKNRGAPVSSVGRFGHKKKNLVYVSRNKNNVLPSLPFPSLLVPIDGPGRFPLGEEPRVPPDLRLPDLDHHPA